MSNISLKLWRLHRFLFGTSLEWHLSRAWKDRHIQKDLHLYFVVKVRRLVDDFIVFVDYFDIVFEAVVSSLLGLFTKDLYPLEFNYELPSGNSFRFLDLTHCLRSNRLCWLFSPRSGKPLLPLHSARSKLVRMGIIIVCMVNALKRSCPHSMQFSLKAQAERFLSAGYSNALISGVAEKILKQIKN